MTKMATVHAQQMWEYMNVSRKTEDFLVAELNEFGKLGWELVGTFYHRDVKSLVESYCWTAVLKRPLVLPPQVKPTDGATPIGDAEAAESELPQGADASIFDLRPMEENGIENGNEPAS